MTSSPMQGQAWQDNVRKCLMWRLIPAVASGATCSALKQTGFDTHPSCYVENGVCTTILGSFTNLIALANVLELSDVQISQVSKNCH